MKPFTQRLHDHALATASVVCVGIDPRPSAHSLTDAATLGSVEAVAAAITQLSCAVLDATHDVVACCKPQAAFFEALGLPGLQALADVMQHARQLGLPIILDAKRGDIGSTAEAYAQAYLTDGAFTADALTVNPYLGMDTLEPFIQAAEANKRGLFVLVRTSNPGSANLQELNVSSGGRLYEHLASQLTERATTLPLDSSGFSLLGAVGGATAPVQLAELRQRLPHSVLLVPGYGAQGGSADDVALAFRPDGTGAVINASRSIMYSREARAATSLADVRSAARTAATKMKDDLTRALAARA